MKVVFLEDVKGRGKKVKLRKFLMATPIIF
jgi:hypothetical protein